MKVHTLLGDSETFVQITNNQLIVPATGTHQNIAFTKDVAAPVSESAVRGKRFNVETFTHTLNAGGAYAQTAGGHLSATFTQVDNVVSDGQGNSFTYDKFNEQGGVQLEALVTYEGPQKTQLLSSGTRTLGIYETQARQ